MRDRLIELIREAEYESLKREMANFIDEIDDDKTRSEFVADHLLANGVIVPPCKVGDKVYYVPFGNHIVECTVARISIEPFAEIGMSFLCYGGAVFDMRDWGKTVFLSREEAEQKLKEGGKE